MSDESWAALGERMDKRRADGFRLHRSAATTCWRWPSTHSVSNPRSNPRRRTERMAFFPKPAAGSWTEHWPELGTAPVNYEDSIDPEHYRLEQQAIFRKTWLKVGRVEQLPKTGQLLHPRDALGGRGHLGDHRQGRGQTAPTERRMSSEAFYNMCRHRGNKLVWSDLPGRGGLRRLPPIHLQVPRLAIRPQRRPELRPAGG